MYENNNFLKIVFGIQRIYWLNSDLIKDISAR